MDDLSNNLKVYEPEVKGTSSSSTNSQNMAFVSSNNSGSTNEAVNTTHGVSAASTQANTANSTNVDNLSDVVIYAFLASQPSSPQQTTTFHALVSCDGLGGYDWSDQAEERPTNYALIAYSSISSNSEVSTDSNCSSSCLENVKTLKEQYDKLLKDYKKSQLMVVAYKTGLEYVEERLVVYKKNEAVYEEDIKLLKLEIHLREIAITELRKKLEKAQQEKDEIQLTVEKFENSSKSLSKLIDSQIVDKCKTKFTREPVVENSEAKASEANLKSVRKNNSALIIEDWVSDSKEEEVPYAKIEKKTVKSGFANIKFVKPKQQEKTARKTVNHVEQNRQNTHTPRGNQRNWNNMLS
ncbi:hypothetical protein Tco_0121213 [Tanacetum coccineum]